MEGLVFPKDVGGVFRVYDGHDDTMRLVIAPDSHEQRWFHMFLSLRSHVCGMLKNMGYLQVCQGLVQRSFFPSLKSDGRVEFSYDAWQQLRIYDLPGIVEGPRTGDPWQPLGVFSIPVKHAREVYFRMLRDGWSRSSRCIEKGWCPVENRNEWLRYVDEDEDCGLGADPDALRNKATEILEMMRGDGEEG
jgi:hypothetical protein